MNLFLLAVHAALTVLPAPKEEQYVELDFATMPCETRGYTLTLRVYTTSKELWFEEKSNAPKGCPRRALCDFFVAGLKEVGFRAEAVGGTKVRVYGGTEGGKFYPATSGTAEVPGFKKDELPTIKVVTPKKS